MFSKHGKKRATKHILKTLEISYDSYQLTRLKHNPKGWENYLWNSPKRLYLIPKSFQESTNQTLASCSLLLSLIIPFHSCCFLAIQSFFILASSSQIQPQSFFQQTLILDCPTSKALAYQSILQSSSSLFLNHE
jgi:hypothetical protein